MNNQLALLADATAREQDASWELDDHDREIGRLGLAAARQALRQSSASRIAA